MTEPSKPSEALKTPSFAAMSAKDRLLAKIQEDPSMPTLGVAVAKVVEITSSSADSVSTLAHFVLADVALTQKILRLSNTIHYRNVSSPPVTTISRAIYLLGFNAIKNSAMAMLLVDGFANKRQAYNVRKELIHSLCASMIASELARQGKFPDAEECAVVALFKNIGKVLVASFDHQLHEQIRVRQTVEPEQAWEIVTALLGCSYQRFGELVLQEWKMPDGIIQALQPLPHGELKKATHRTEWLRHVASFSDELASLLIHGEYDESNADMVARCEPLIKRYGRCLEIDQESLEDMLRRVETETRQLANSMDIAMPSFWTDGMNAQIRVNEIGSEFMLRNLDADSMHEAPRYPSGKPSNARDLLLAGVQDVTQMLAADQVKLNDMFLLVLETLYTGLGFRFATICLRDVQHSRYTARASLGHLYMERQKGFVLPTSPEDTLFHVAMINNNDLVVANALHPKIQGLLPAWHKKLLPDTRSFMILPLVVNHKPLGFFYADRVHTAEEGVPADETSLIKTLKSQLITAIVRK